MRLRITVLFFACALMGVCASPASEAVKPNILVVVSDDQGHADVGFHGSKEAVTPHLDALARAGVRCTNGYASHCFCSPSRAGLLTGRYQARFGYSRNPKYAPNDDRVGLPLAERLLPQYLAEAGYGTGWVGKWHLGASPKHLPSNRGFDETFGFIGGSHHYRDWKAGQADNLLPLVRNGKPIADVPAHLTTAFGAETVKFIRRNQRRPWMLYLAFNAPHAPHEPTAEREAKFRNIANSRRRKYLAQISLMDDAIGAVMAELKHTHQARRTLVFFFSDNGGQPLHSGENAPLRGGKGTLYEGGARVPFVVSWPGTLPEGKLYEEPVITLDVLATALAVAGARPSKGTKLDGVDLMPYLLGKVKTPPHERLYWRTTSQGRVGHAVREDRWKLVRVEEGPTELYDLAADIGESKDLSAKKPEIVKRLIAAANEWDKEVSAEARTDKRPPSK